MKGLFVKLHLLFQPESAMKRHSDMMNEDWQLSSNLEVKDCVSAYYDILLHARALLLMYWPMARIRFIYVRIIVITHLSVTEVTDSRNPQLAQTHSLTLLK